MTTLQQAPAAIPLPSARLVDVDLVRVLGLGAVVLGHVVTVGLLPVALYAFHVPLFFFLTGYLWRPGRTVARELRTRARTLLVPYACWLGIISVVLLVGLQLAEHRPIAWHAIAGGVRGGTSAVRPFTAFWFVPVLFGAAVLTRALERLRPSARWAVAIAGLVAGTAVGPLLAHLPLGLGLVWPGASLVLLGQLLPGLLARVRRPALTGAILVIAGETPVLAGWIRPFDMKPGSFGTPFLSLAAAFAITGGLMLLARTLAPVLSERIRRVITLLAGYAMTIILTHAAVLFVLNTPPVGGPLDLIAALLVPCLGAALLSRTPLRRALVG